MNRIFLIASVLLLTSFLPLQAQDRLERNEQIQSQKVAFLTKKMNLTVEEAELFWPIYNAYDEKQRQLTEEVKSNLIDPTDEQAMAILEAHINKAEKEIALKRDFLAKASQVVSYRKLYELEKGEREFRLWILNRYNELRGKKSR